MLQVDNLQSGSEKNMQQSRAKRVLIALLLTAAMILSFSVNAFAALETEADRLNAADLEPQQLRSAVLDDYVEDILDEILHDDMDPFEQVKACYDYVVDIMSYGSHTSKLGTPVADGVTCRDIYNSYGEVEGFGAVALTANTGMCNAYASAFILMTRKIGYDAYLVKGSTRSAGGGYAYHEWAEINVDGNVYLFDPQLEQDLVGAGLGDYAVFCKTYDQVSGRYSK